MIAAYGRARSNPGKIHLGTFPKGCLGGIPRCGANGLVRCVSEKGAQLVDCRHCLRLLAAKTS